ncbi:MAG: carboxypeptidase regulatory-like domain-containing protein [Sedimentisphaerales bacterium]|nr:carboxypeptidase regulatory-like domain-containing protein [Sedimentisphaerales bacterium]
MSKKISLTLFFMLTSLAWGQIGESVEITGQVRDYQTRMVEGADIAIFEIHRDDYYSPTSVKLLDKFKKTDHEGRFVFNITPTPRHDIYVVARKEGLALGWYYIYKKRIYEAKPDDNFADIVLPKPYTLAGRVVDSEGKLVAGANVQVFTRETGEVFCDPKDWFSVKTDSKGRFVFNNLPLDLMVKFFIEVPDRDIAYIYPPREREGNACGGYHVDWEDLELTLPPEATVQGRVIDKGSGKGLKDMLLLIFTSEGAETEWRFRSCVRSTLTNGDFEFQGVPPGKHILRFISSKTGPNEWAGKNVPITVSRGDKNVRKNILVEKGVPLEVIVKDPTTGKALPRMKVQVFDDGWNYEQKDIFIRETRADANGRAHLMVPQGRYGVHAWGGNYETRMNFKGAEVNIAGSQPASVEILVKPRLHLVRGTVVDTQGQSAENVYITVGLGQRVLTDNNGRFQGMQSPLYPSHLVVARDKKNNLAGYNYFYDAMRELRVVLRPGCSIIGRVTDDMGRGIAGANVNISLDRKDGIAHLDTAGTRTDSQGYYRLETVAPLKSSFRYDLSFDAVEFAPTRYTLTEPMKPGEEVTIPNMQLVSLDAFISGVVLDENNNPVARQPVFVSSEAGGSHIGKGTSTDELGRFKFKRIPEGPVTLQSGFGQGSDAAYIYAHSRDNVPIKLGNHFKNYFPPSSLVGSQLPDLRVLEMGFDYKHFKNKKNLVVFIDYTKRPSQIAVNSLKRRQLDLRRSNVEIICIQVAPVDEEDFVAWKKENRISFPVYILPGQQGWDSKNNPLVLKQNPEIMNTLRREWGVRSIPWTILTDENQKIVATGLSINRISSLIYEKGWLSPPENIPLGDKIRRQDSPRLRYRRPTGRRLRER